MSDNPDGGTQSQEKSDEDVEVTWHHSIDAGNLVGPPTKDLDLAAIDREIASIKAGSSASVMALTEIDAELTVEREETDRIIESLRRSLKPRWRR